MLVMVNVVFVVNEMTESVMVSVDFNSWWVARWGVCRSVVEH